MRSRLKISSRHGCAGKNDVQSLCGSGNKNLQPNITVSMRRIALGLFLLCLAVFPLQAARAAEKSAARDAPAPEASPTAAAVPAAAPALPASVPADAPVAEAAPTEQPVARRAPALADPHWRALIARLEADGQARERLEQLFTELDRPWSPAFMAAKLHELYGARFGASAQIRAEPEGEPPLLPDYLPPTVSGYAGARALLKEQSALLEEVRTRYGVPPALIAAVFLLETDMGHELGNRSAFYALACMAATRTLDEALEGLEHCRVPPSLRAEMEKRVREKAAWAHKELCALLRYGDGGADILRLPGSIYGALGLCQFMPANIEPYGVDSTGKGIVDLFSVPDAAHSVGNFLKAHGYDPNASVKKQLEVLRRYNQSDSYAALVLGVSLQLAGKRVPPELGMFSTGSRWGGRKSWQPKFPPLYRLPPLGNYKLK